MSADFDGEEGVDEVGGAAQLAPLLVPLSAVEPFRFAARASDPLETLHTYARSLVGVVDGFAGHRDSAHRVAHDAASTGIGFRQDLRPFAVG